MIRVSAWYFAFITLWLINSLLWISNWAGVHYKSDNEAGELLGRKVGEEIVKWAKSKTSISRK